MGSGMVYKFILQPSGIQQKKIKNLSYKSIRLTGDTSLFRACLNVFASLRFRVIKCRFSG